MRKIIVAFFSLVLSINAFSQSSKHIVLISIDGLRPEFYLDKSWPAPNLQQLLKNGVHAKRMKSVFPSFTYPAHVAMLTGAMPARIGICYNAKPNSEDWYWFTADIRVPTLWQAMKQNNLSTAAVQWPVSVDTNITYCIPEIWSNKHPEDRITTSRTYATKGLIEEIEANATGKLTGDNMNEEHLSLDANSGRIAAYIFKTYKPNLLAVHFACVDGAEHEQGREGDKVRLALASADRAIGDIIESVERSGLKDSTTILIVGDHGFADIKQMLRPNVWIKDLNMRFQPAGGAAFLYGRRETGDGRRGSGDGRREAGIGRRQTGDGRRASYAEAAKRRRKTGDGLRPPEPCEGGREELINEVIARLNSLPTDQRKLFRIIDRKELDKMGADSSALLAIAAVPGTVFSGSTEGEQLSPAKGGHHGYDPNLPEMYTGFIAAGAEIQKGKVIDELCVTDIAPLIAKLLGISFNSVDGKLVQGILK